MEYLHVRNGLGELFQSLFMLRTMRSIVQVRVGRQDKSMEDHGKVRGLELELHSIQFKGVENIEEKLDNLTRRG